MTDSLISPFSARLISQIMAKSREKKWTLAAAESCTGGLLCACLTKFPGASQFFLGGVVAYDNAVKTSLLCVSEDVLEKHGAVSAETARIMAESTLKTFASDLACAITGVAGPDGGTAKKPVGLVYISLAFKTRPPQTRENFFPYQGRDFIRSQAVQTALEMIDEQISGVKQV